MNGLDFFFIVILNAIRNNKTWILILIHEWREIKFIIEKKNMPSMKTNNFAGLRHLFYLQGNEDKWKVSKKMKKWET